MKKFGYNKRRDRCAVSPLSAGVDLRVAYVNNAVPANIAGSISEYNDVDDPEGIMNHPADIFEQYRQRDYVQNALSSKKSEKDDGAFGEVTTPTGEN